MNIFAKSATAAIIALLPTTALADWSGFYLGGSIGTTTNAELVNPDDSSDTLEFESHGPLGAFLGYQVQNGDFVFGGEYALSAASDIGVEDISGDGGFDGAYGDLKARAGYSLGDVLVYGTVGISAIAFTADGGDVTGSGFGFGVGADYAVNENFVIGAEYFARRTSGEISTAGPDLDVDFNVDTLSLRAAYKF